MNSNINKQSVLSSVIWKFLERGGTQGVQLLVQLLLARLLTPEAFGTIAIVQVFISLANVFIQSGFSTSLIQKKDADDLDFSSVFYISLLMSGIIYLVIFLISPLIAHFYSNPLLVSILRVLSLNLFAGSLNSVQNSYIAKHMMFRKQFLSSLISGILSGLVGIALAFAGLGVWALVAQQLVNQYTISIVLWFTVNWRPTLNFSLKRIKGLFTFGSNLLISALVETLFNNLRTLIIGRLYTSGTLGYHDKGQSVPQVLTMSINGALQSVMLPTYSKFQDERSRLKRVVRRSMMTSSYLVFPMMIGLAVIAEPLVILILTETWSPAIPFIQIYSISMMFMPIHTTNLQAINAIGRSDIFLKLEMIKKIIGLVVLGISLPFGVKAIAISSIPIAIISAFINALPNRTFLQYGYKEQISDLMPALLLSSIMGLVVFSMNYIDVVIWLKLILQILVGAIIYFGLSKLFKIEILDYLLSTSREFLKRRK